MKNEFEDKFVLDRTIYLEDSNELWAWIEDKLDKARIEGEVGKYELSIKLARIKAIDDAISYFVEELDRLIRTKQIDMVHTNLDNIEEDLVKQLKEKK